MSDSSGIENGPEQGQSLSAAVIDLLILVFVRIARYYFLYLLLGLPAVRELPVLQRKIEVDSPTKPVRILNMDMPAIGGAVLAFHWKAVNRPTSDKVPVTQKSREKCQTSRKYKHKYAR